MGKTNSKIPMPLPIIKTKADNIPKENLLTRIYSNERKMIIYNICPKHLGGVQLTKKSSKLLLKRKYCIKSMKIGRNALLRENSTLSKILPRMKNLNRLDIEYWGNSLINLSAFKSFSKAISNLKNLKLCMMKHHDPNKDSLKGSSFLIYHLSELHKLKNVNLSFSTWMTRDVREEDLKPFLLSTMKLRKVENFCLDLSACFALTDDSLEVIATRFNRFSKLRDLKLDFRDTEKITQAGIHSLLGRLTDLKLSSLDLKFRGNDTIKDAELLLISRTLNKLDGISKINLSLEGFDEIHLDGISYLIESLNRIKSLTQLGLDFRGCQSLTDFEIKSMIEGIVFSEKLKYLHLDLSHCSIGDASIIHISEYFARFLNVQDLSIVCGGHSNITDQALIKLSEALIHLKELKSLHIEFTQTQITDKGFMRFAQEVTRLNLMKRLEIVFSMNPKITGKGIAEFGECVIRAKGLVELKIILNHCNSITKDSIRSLTERITQIKALSHSYKIVAN